MHCSYSLVLSFILGGIFFSALPDSAPNLIVYVPAAMTESSSIDSSTEVAAASDGTDLLFDDESTIEQSTSAVWDQLRSKALPVADLARPAAPPVYPKICFLAQSSGLYTKDAHSKEGKESFKRRLDILRNISLYSWDLALANSTAARKPLVRCKVTGWESNFKTFDEFEAYMGTFSNVQVDFIDNHTAIKESLIVNADKCDWIVNTRLDGDDAITPGYWNYIEDMIRAKRFDPAGAGVVGTRLIPVIESTPDKCRAIIDGNKEIVKSQGITTVYRWDIFEKMKYPFGIGSHAVVLGNLRLRYNGLVQGNTSALALVSSKFNDHAEMINSTGVHYVDSMVEDWGPPALWVRTSLSSHFPWIEMKKLPDGCDLNKWNNAINSLKGIHGRFTPDFLSHIYEYRNIGHLPLLDACKSNSYFLRFQFARMRLANKTKAKTCEEFVDLYQVYM